MRNQGFTMIELMIVVMIITLMGALTAPNIPAWTTSLRLHTSVREVASALQLARLKAIAQNTEWRACFYAAKPPDFPNDFFSIHANSTGWCDTPPSQGDAEFLPFKKTVTVLPARIRLAKSPKNLRFRPRGSAVGGTIRLENTFQKTHTDIVVALTGRVKIMKD